MHIIIVSLCEATYTCLLVARAMSMNESSGWSPNTFTERPFISVHSAVVDLMVAMHAGSLSNLLQPPRCESNSTISGAFSLNSVMTASREKLYRVRSMVTGHIRMEKCLHFFVKSKRGLLLQLGNSSISFQGCQ